MTSLSHPCDHECGGDAVSQEVAGEEDDLEAAEEGDEEGEAREVPRAWRT